MPILTTTRIATVYTLASASSGVDARFQMLKIEPTKRFSSRAENYRRARPSYPKEIISIVKEQCGLTSAARIADVGSGTGIFTRLLVGNGNHVFGVEPNPEMRRAGEKYLSAYANFVSVAGSAEDTTLPDQAVDLITIANAAHWFEREKSLREFQRILTREGFLVLIENHRRLQGSEFGCAYEQLVRDYGTDYSEVQRRGKSAQGNAFFAPFRCEKRALSNYQDLDYAHLEARLLSSSFVPQPGDEHFAVMLAELRRIFDKYQQDGRVRMEHDINVYIGRISEQQQAS
ncbi:MAG: class I SAM-dependent methyltransferase [Acidobacteria bacterium]|nr:class I SAM-dependent methyltransferase [Acidobacteriota bacterium]